MFHEIKTYGGKTQKYSLHPEVPSYLLEHEQTRNVKFIKAFSSAKKSNYKLSKMLTIIMFPK